MSAARSYVRLTLDDLAALRDAALREHADYFFRNAHLKEGYGEALVCACLCQGAAWHWLDPAIGVKDYDLWFFYRECAGVRLNARGRLTRNRPTYQGRPIDLLKRSIPTAVCDAHPGAPGEAVVAYLRRKDTHTKRLLLRKAGVGLHPASVFGVVLWTPET